MSGVLRQCSELYRALLPAGITPAQADDLELWQIAALMERSATDIMNDPEEMNRRIIEARYKAHAEGRELDADEVFSGMSEQQIANIALVAPPVST